MSQDTASRGGTLRAGESRNLRALWRVVFEKELIILKRYWFNTLAGVLANYIMFAFLFFGGQVAAPTLIDDHLAGLIVGFFVWTMAWGTFQATANTITREAQWGTLEQMYMTPFGLLNVVVARLFVQITVSLVSGSLILISMMVTTQTWLSISPLTVVPLAFVTMASATAVGFAFGGLALIYKRISSVFLIVQFLLLGAINAPDELLGSDLLPLAYGTDLLVRAMDASQPVALWEFEPFALFKLGAVTLGYVVFGVLAFRYAVGVAKRRGVMGHY